MIVLRRGTQEGSHMSTVRIGRAVLRDALILGTSTTAKNCNYIGAFVIERDMDEDAEK